MRWESKQSEELQVGDSTRMPRRPIFCLKVNTSVHEKKIHVQHFHSLFVDIY